MKKRVNRWKEEGTKREDVAFERPDSTRPGLSFLRQLQPQKVRPLVLVRVAKCLNQFLHLQITVA